MKKLRLRKWVKYTILFTINFIIIINLPNILKNVENNVNNFRYNVFIIFLIFIGNLVAISKIEKEVK